jgi:hypothetical protein
MRDSSILPAQAASCAHPKVIVWPTRRPDDRSPSHPGGSQFRFPISLQRVGTGTGNIKTPAQTTIQKRAPAHHVASRHDLMAFGTRSASLERLTNLPARVIMIPTSKSSTLQPSPSSKRHCTGEHSR